ncbi:MAG: hypothetical protein UGF89_08635 [Acutalibacteraceae bacterium]|nr:hypothetical protein [Acutalibacteraceae bacterium]
MKEFNRLFNIFTVLAIVIMLLTTVVAASITVIEKGKSNLYSVNATRNEFFISEYCINLV